MLEKLAAILWTQLIVEYGILAILYALNKQWHPAFYWFASVLITWAVFLMRKG